MTDIEVLQQIVRELTIRVSLLEDAMEKMQKAKAEARAALLRIAAKRKTIKERKNNARSKKAVRYR